MAPRKNNKRKRNGNRVYKQNARSSGYSAYKKPNNNYYSTYGLSGKFTGPGKLDKYVETTHNYDKVIDDAVASSKYFQAQQQFIIARGTGPRERIGSKVIIKKMMMRYTFNMPVYSKAAADSDQQPTDVDFRMIVYIDTQWNGSAISDFNLPFVVDDPSDIRTFNRMDGTGRFRILKDKYFKLRPNPVGISPTANMYYAPVTKTGFCKIKIPKGLIVDYDDGNSAGTENGIRSNNILVAIIGIHGHNLTLTDENQVEFTWRTRIRFDDVAN